MKKLQIKVGLEVETIDVDLRVPIKDFVKKFCLSKGIRAYNEYAFSLNLNATDMKTMTTMRKQQTLIKDGRKAEKMMQSLATSDQKIWLDEHRSFSDDPNIIAFPQSQIQLERLVFFTDTAIKKSSKAEASIMYPSLREKLASGHFRDLSDADHLNLMRMAIAIEYDKKYDGIVVKKFDQSLYLAKNRHLKSTKKLLDNMQDYAGFSTLDLQYNFLDLVRQSSEWGLDTFVVREILNQTSEKGKFMLLGISKKGVHKANISTKALEITDTIKFNQISTFRCQEKGISLKLTNQKEEKYITEEGNKIITILSRYIDCERESQPSTVM